MREGLIEQKNNTQIDKNNLVASKQIIVPKTSENREEYLARIDMKRLAFERFREVTIGFVKHLEDEEEVDEEDEEPEEDTRPWVVKVVKREATVSFYFSVEQAVF